MIGLINVRIYDFNEYVDNGYIIYDQKIIDIGSMDDFYKLYLVEGDRITALAEGFAGFAERKEDVSATVSGAEVKMIDGSGYLVLPGLVNGHNHIYSTFARGMQVAFNPQNFQEILDQLWWKLDGQLDLNSVYYSGLMNGYENLKNGVTAMNDHHASGKDVIDSIDALRKAVVEDIGIRGSFCFETSDRFDVKQCIEENRDGEFIGLHASMSLRDESLALISEEIKRNPKPIHVHVAESLMDQELCIEKYGERIVERLDRFGLLTKNSLLAHCIYINEDEAKIIKDRQCVIAVNVTSNMNNSVGLPDIKMFKRFGIPVIIGNDGIAMDIASEWRMVYYAMHHRYGSPTAFGYDELLEMINDTYDYMSGVLGCKLGRLQQGYEADIITLPYKPITPIDGGNVFGHLFFGMLQSFKPNNVWCGGKWLIKEYDYNPSVFEQEIIDDGYMAAHVEVKKTWKAVSDADDL